MNVRIFSYFIMGLGIAALLISLAAYKQAQGKLEWAKAEYAADIQKIDPDKSLSPAETERLVGEGLGYLPLLREEQSVIDKCFYASIGAGVLLFLGVGLFVASGPKDKRGFDQPARTI